MSDDDEDVAYIPKIKSIHYGSLEEAEKARLEAEQEEDGEEEESETAQNGNNVHISNGAYPHDLPRVPDTKSIF